MPRRNGRQVYCSDTCRSREKQRLKGDRRETLGLPRHNDSSRKRPLEARTCSTCQAPFETTHPRKRFCTRRCHQRSRDIARGFGHRGRARLAGAPYETVDKWVVFDRDGWRCGLCRRLVDRELFWPNRRCAVLDHVVPLSVPGSPGHVPSNVQCAHNDCNSQKGNKLGPGVQPALF